MYLNRAFVSGNVAADPEVREVSGKKGASFRIGITEKYKDTSGQWQEKTEWVNIIAWGRQAEVAEKYVRKGTAVFVEGKLQNRQWVDRDGNKRYVTEVLASNVQADVRTARRQEDGRQNSSDDYNF